MVLFTCALSMARHKISGWRRSNFRSLHLNPWLVSRTRQSCVRTQVEKLPFSAVKPGNDPGNNTPFWMIPKPILLHSNSFAQTVLPSISVKIQRPLMLVKQREASLVRRIRKHRNRNIVGIWFITLHNPTRTKKRKESVTCVVWLHRRKNTDIFIGIDYRS